ncbi:MAG TPA: hypothetical protein VK539_10465 [Myxococcaceae bacterium]|nr:hypothetical protein [Myxococcaceae bacterium]
MAQRPPAATTPAAPPLGLRVDEKKGTIQGTVQPTMLEGRKQVDVPGLGSLVAPEPGKTDGYLLGADKMLSLKANADGTVTVNTRTLGLEAGKKGQFQGNLLPMDGKVDIGGKQLDVSGLKPGESKTKTVKLNGKKHKVKLKMNEDGTVSLQGKPKKGLFAKVAGFFGKALSFVGKIAPFLAAVPGLGAAALVAKVASGINAVKGFVGAIKSGNLLGAVASAAGAVGSFASGVVGNIANKIAQGASWAQQALHTFKHGLGQGLLQVVSNGASLLSGAAGLAGNQKLASTAGQVADYASAADSARRGNLLPAATQFFNDFGARLVRSRQPQEQFGFTQADLGLGLAQGSGPAFDTKNIDVNNLGFYQPDGTIRPAVPSSTSSFSSPRLRSLDNQGVLVASTLLGPIVGDALERNKPRWKPIAQVPNDPRKSNLENDVNRLAVVSRTTYDQMNRLGLRHNDPNINNGTGSLLWVQLHNYSYQEFEQGTLPNRYLVCDEQAKFLAAQLAKQRFNSPVIIRVVGESNEHAWVRVEFPRENKAYKLDLWDNQVTPMQDINPRAKPRFSYDDVSINKTPIGK